MVLPQHTYPARPAEHEPEAGPPVPTARRCLLRFVERALGECFALSLRIALLTIAVVVLLLTVIAYTLSIGNALLVIAAAAVMRLTCERRNHREP